MGRAFSSHTHWNRVWKGARVPLQKNGTSGLQTVRFCAILLDIYSLKADIAKAGQVTSCRPINDYVGTRDRRTKNRDALAKTGRMATLTKILHFRYVRVFCMSSPTVRDAGVMFLGYPAGRPSVVRPSVT